MSPILVRPVREQLEHDRIIRLLQAKSRRSTRPDEPWQRAERRRSAAARRRCIPDLVLQSLGARPSAAGGRRGRDRRVGQPSRGAGASGRISRSCARRSTCTCPSSMVDVARRLCEDNQIHRQRDLELSRRRRRGPVHARPSSKEPCRREPVEGPTAPRTGAARPAVPSGCRAAHGRRCPRGKPARAATRGRAKRPSRPAAPRASRPRKAAAEAQSRAKKRRASRKKTQVDTVAVRSRFSRDKRGYEHIYLIHASQHGAASPRARDSVLVSHAARRQGRPRAVRRGRAAGARSAVSRRRVRLGGLIGHADRRRRTSSTGASGGVRRRPPGRPRKRPSERRPRRRASRCRDGDAQELSPAGRAPRPDRRQSAGVADAVER